MKLLPCPFCGIAKHLQCLAQPHYPPQYVIACDNCGARGPQIQPGVDTDGNWSQREAREAWNTRNGT